ncbi:MAG: DUF4232 domain-containing protein [Mycobacteriales bacterium]
MLVVAVLLATAACSSSSPHVTPTAPQEVPPSASPSSPASAAASAGSLEPTPSPTPTTTATPPDVATPVALGGCTSAQLRLSAENGDSGAGQFHQGLVLTNRGPRCALQGYPGVSFVDRAGRTLGSPAAVSTATVRRVVLEPGRAATALLTYSNAGAYPDSSCRPVQADRVRVYPPGQRSPLLVADPILVCSATGAGQLHIGPVAG